jgi:aspartyl-tRNA(Asn)/glutamyl-tRNA(Gln) amidotransferase subunit C
MPITRADVEKIAELARLELTPEETAAFTEQLGAILNYIDKLNELDTTDITPMSHCLIAETDIERAGREDVARPGLGQKLAIENAPDSEAGFFKVPKVIGGL